MKREYNIRGWEGKEMSVRKIMHLQQEGSVLGARQESRTCPPLCGMSVRLVCLRAIPKMKECGKYKHLGVKKVRLKVKKGGKG